MKAKFRVGDSVRIPFGARTVPGVITELRGPLGVKGRQLYQVEVPMDPFDPEFFERTEDEIEALPSPREPEKPIDRDKIIQYFKDGGLLLILQSNLSGGRNAPRVWLCRDHLGNVTHTFFKDRGLIGGETVPCQGAEFGHIVARKQEEVVRFLRSFGLDEAQVLEVVRSVGTVAH